MYKFKVTIKGTTPFRDKDIVCDKVFRGLSAEIGAIVFEGLSVTNGSIILATYAYGDSILSVRREFVKALEAIIGFNVEALDVYILLNKTGKPRDFDEDLNEVFYHVDKSDLPEINVTNVRL